MKPGRPGAGQGAVSTFWLELELERRRPAPDASTTAAQEAAPLLAGITVTEGRLDETGIEEHVRASAARTVQAFNNTHDCSEARDEPEACTHPDHYKDLARCRSDLMKLGLEDFEVKLARRRAP